MKFQNIKRILHFSVVKEQDRLSKSKRADASFMGAASDLSYRSLSELLLENIVYKLSIISEISLAIALSIFAEKEFTSPSHVPIVRLSTLVRFCSPYLS